MRRALIPGERKGRLTLVQFVERRGSSSMCLWKCECGEETIASLSNVRHGTTESCGCLRRERARLKKTVHGGKGTPEYQAWKHMIRRCENRASGDFHNYGGRGISVSPTWRRDFAKFRSDMGPRPSPVHSIDRIDSNGNYEPGNCRWATPSVQGRNKRNTEKYGGGGIVRPLVEWCERMGANYNTARRRIREGFPWHIAIDPRVNRAFKAAVYRSQVIEPEYWTDFKAFRERGYR